MPDFTKAKELIHQFKGEAYLYGLGVLHQVGSAVAPLGRRAALVADRFPGSDEYIDTITCSLDESGVQILEQIPGAAPNAPREDLSRITQRFVSLQPDVIVTFGGGSTIDASKAAEVLRTLDGSIEDYFGTGLVTQTLESSGKRLSPHVAIQTASSSAAHLTKYSNITEVKTGQKKLVVDNAIVPPRPVFDYSVTYGSPATLTADGALDGIAHALEVLYSAVGRPEYQLAEAIAVETIRLVVNHLPEVLADPRNAEGRVALGLATDLGGYAIMIGGTNGAHLTSFSLVDILSHGRATGMLNPYYTVFFAPAVEQPLRAVGECYRQADYTRADLESLGGRELGLAVAEAMIAFEKRVGFPTTLSEVEGFSDAHVERALTAAKNPQLKMKLENMPVRLTAEMVDEYMGPILRAAKTGDLKMIKNVPA